MIIASITMLKFCIGIAETKIVNIFVLIITTAVYQFLPNNLFICPDQSGAGSILLLQWVPGWERQPHVYAAQSWALHC